MKGRRIPKGRGFWLRLAGSLLALALLAVLLYRQDWVQIGAALAGLDAWRLWTALILTALSRLAVALRWHTLLEVSPRRLPLRVSLKITLAGLFASNFLPTTVGGDVVRLAGAARGGIDPAMAAFSLIADRVVGMAGMALLLPWGAARLLAADLPALLEPQASAGAWAGGVLPQALRRIQEKTSRFLGRMGQSLSLWYRRPAALVLPFLSTGLHMLLLFSTIWLVLDGLNERLGWFQIAGIWSLVYFITLLPISINGYGLQEVSATLLYSRLGGISLSASLAVVLILRTLQVATSLPGVLFLSGVLADGRTDEDGQPGGAAETQEHTRG